MTPTTNYESARQVLAACAQLGIEPVDAEKAPTAIILKRRPCRFERRLTTAVVCPTKEGEMTYSYDRFRVCFSVDTKGHLRNREDQVDVYAWTNENYEKKAEKCVPVGINSEEGQANLDALYAILSDEQDKEELAEWFGEYRVDHEMVFTKAEWRKVIVVTRALYEAGVTYVINSWCDEPNAPLTPLIVGDVLVVEEGSNGTLVYRIAHDEFVDKHPNHAYLVDSENL